MKYFIALFIVLLFCCSSVFGQTPVFTNNAVADNGFAVHEPLNEYSTPRFETDKKKRIVRLGKRFMIIGGAQLLGGGIILLTVTPSSNVVTGIFEDLGIVVLVVDGAAFVLAGAITFVCGKIYEQKHPGRYSLITKRNQVGFAYNF